jgi:type IV fimbrial biogenesis protein FimT
MIIAMAGRYLLTKRSLGFTLVELMVAVAILAILAAFAAPSLQSAFDRYRVNAASDDFRSSLNYARSEAIRTRSRISVARSSSNNGVVCATAEEWQCGWIIYRDTNANNVRDVATEPVLKAIEAMPGGTVAMMNPAAQTQIRFDQWGNVTPLGAFSIRLLPRGDIASPDIATFCASSGARFRLVNDIVCP